MVRKMYLWRTLISSIIFCILPLYMAVIFREKEINTVIRASMGGEVYSPLTMVYIILIFFTPLFCFSFCFPTSFPRILKLWQSMFLPVQEIPLNI